MEGVYFTLTGGTMRLGLSEDGARVRLSYVVRQRTFKADDKAGPAVESAANRSGRVI
jgi:hypothetical protein